MISAFRVRVGRLGPAARPVIALVVVILALAAAGPRAALAASPPSGPSAGAAVGVPDVIVELPPGAGTALAPLVAALQGRPGIAWAAADPGIVPPQILVSLAPGADRAGLASVREAVGADQAGSPAVLAGRALVDEEARHRLGRAALLVGLVAALVAGGLAGWLVGLIEGLVAGATVALAALLGGAVGGKVADRFDGSLTTSRLPAVLVALVVAVWLMARLLQWFARPAGADGAQMVRLAVRSVTGELVLLAGGLGLVAAMAELAAPARTMALVALVAALAAAAAVLAAGAPALALLHGTRWAAPAAAGTTSRMATLGGLDDGRSVAWPFLAGLGTALVVLGLFSFRPVAVTQLIDGRSLSGPAGSTTDDLARTAGDPTAGVLARFAPGTDQRAKAAWLARTSQLPLVARVETATVRYVGGAPLDASAGLPLKGAGIDGGDELPTLALVVPATAGRSAEAQRLVAAIEGGSAPVRVELSGMAVDARNASRRDGGSIWLLIVGLALAAAAPPLILLSSWPLAARAGGLRLLGSAAVAGLYHLETGHPAGGEIQLAVLVTAVGGALYELGVLRRLLVPGSEPDAALAPGAGPTTGASPAGDWAGDRAGGEVGPGGRDLLGRALHREGWAALGALAVVAVAGLGLLAVDLAVVRRLGLVLLLAVAVEVVIGGWLLRPPLLFAPTAALLARAPRPAAGLALAGAPVAPPADRELAAATAGLLQAELAAQGDPDRADLGRVYLSGGPAWRRAVDQHRSLADAGLRVTGEPPGLHRFRLVGPGEPAAVVATVDQPPRQLVNDQGAVVGVRRAERRSVLLWLTSRADGSPRIDDSVELGSEPRP